MAFPTIPTTAAGRVLTANQLDTTATRTFPDLSGLTKNSGDLLIAIVVAYQTSTGTNAAFSGWSTGWTEFHDSATSSTLAMGAAYKWSTGSETGAITVTQAATITGDAAMILLSIPGVHATTPPEAGSRASGTSAAADPAAFNPAGWDVEDTLWISVIGSGMTSGTGSWTGTGSTAPTNYTNFVRTNASDTSTVGDTEAAVSFRQNTAASEDVGTAGVDTSNAINGAFVIAVRPTAPPDAPTGVAATAVSDHDIDVTWNYVTGATSYTVERSPDGSTGWTTLGTTATATYRDATGSPSTVYYYRVSSTNAVGTGSPSSVVNATTLAAQTDVYADTYADVYGAPSAVPTDVRVSFPSPSTNLTNGQEFRALVRRKEASAPATNPTVALELWESGSKVADVVTGVAVTSTTGQVASGTWQATALAAVSGANVECKVVSAGSSGGTVEVGAVEWNLTRAAATNNIDKTGGSAGGVAATGGKAVVHAKTGGGAAGAAAAGAKTVTSATAYAKTGGTATPAAAGGAKTVTSAVVSTKTGGAASGAAAAGGKTVSSSVSIKTGGAAASGAASGAETVTAATSYAKTGGGAAGAAAAGAKTVTSATAYAKTGGAAGTGAASGAKTVGAAGVSVKTGAAAGGAAASGAKSVAHAKTGSAAPAAAASAAKTVVSPGVSIKTGGGAASTAATGAKSVVHVKTGGGAAGGAATGAFSSNAKAKTGGAVGSGAATGGRAVTTATVRTKTGGAVCATAAVAARTVAHDRTGGATAALATTGLRDLATATTTDKTGAAAARTAATGTLLAISGSPKVWADTPTTPAGIRAATPTAPARPRAGTPVGV